MLRPALALAAVLLMPSPIAAQTAGSAPLELRRGDRVILLGNTLAERMQHFNHFETLLMTRFADLRLAVRNLGWSADTITLQPRPLNFGTTPTHLYRQKADVILAFFGLNESFLGEAGLAAFEADLETFLRSHLAAKYNGTSPVRVALVSPIAHERLDRLPAVDAGARNRELARYTEVMRRVAERSGVAFADIFTPTLTLMSAGGPPLTINGIHLNAHGDRVVARLLMDALGFGDGRGAGAGGTEAPLAQATPARLEALREAIADKNQQFFYRFRPVNAEYVVGRRVEPFGSVNFPKEMEALDRMVAERDRRIWALAAKLKGVTYASQGVR